MRLRQTVVPYDTNRNSHAVKASLNIRITKDLPAVRESRIAPLASSRRSVCCGGARKTVSEKTLRGEARVILAREGNSDIIAVAPVGQYVNLFTAPLAFTTTCIMYVNFPLHP